MGTAAADYLEDNKDHKGRPHDKVEVLRGDPFRVGQIADSLEFKHRQTAGVIAWAPEDSPTPEQIDTVLDHFERLAWAGMDPERTAWSAVRHDEASGGVHVHIMTARVGLQTGKSLNIAPRVGKGTLTRYAICSTSGTAGPGRMTRPGQARCILHPMRKKSELRR